MRRISLMGMILAGLLAAVPASAATQEVGGTVIVPSAWEGCGGFVDAVLQTGVRQGGRLDAIFAVQSQAWGKAFTLSPNLPLSDVNIAFFAGGTRLKEFAAMNFNGESGSVPVGATQARVCLYAGAPTAFTYRAG